MWRHRRTTYIRQVSSVAREFQAIRKVLGLKIVDIDIEPPPNFPVFSSSTMQEKSTLDIQKHFHQQ